MKKKKEKGHLKSDTIGAILIRVGDSEDLDIEVMSSSGGSWLKHRGRVGSVIYR